MSLINAFSAHYLYSALFENGYKTTSTKGKAIEEWCEENETEILNLIVYSNHIIGRPAEYVRKKATVNSDGWGVHVEFTLVDSGECYHTIELTGPDPYQIPDCYDHWI